MADKYLMILEVSQKQAYIFGEKKLQKNIWASDTIAYVTDPRFFKREFPDLFEEKENLIYSGGGHTILMFPDREKAETFARKVSKHVLDKLPGLELFIKIQAYEDTMSPEKNISELRKALEYKKSLRKASFYQSTFGIEKSLRLTSVSGKEMGKVSDDSYRKEISEIMEDKQAVKAIGDYLFSNELNKLGGTKGDNNFIAVVHIDGNQMGARVYDLKEQIKKECEEKKIEPASPEELELWKQRKKEFSDSIDHDFKEAFYEMLGIVREELENGKLKDRLTLSTDKETGRTIFPVRKIITAGDDICFITEGRIGIECAVHYIRCLEKKRNSVDKKPYAACAGIAIVHQKYPFYRAYDMAEQLCSHAKQMMARRIETINKELISNKDDEIKEGGLSAVDWHIEYGEMSGDLEEVRSKYNWSGTEGFCGRPYQITPVRGYISQYASYEQFRRLVLSLQTAVAQDQKQSTVPMTRKEKREQVQTFDFARSKMKSLRNAIKAGPKELERYCRINLLPAEFNGSKELFDALEAVDVFIPLENRKRTRTDE
ncbi:MAG: hypothetical protein SO101_01810 [Lachnospiraceae bacterium]|nr:hypothetical protein [Lachnospiraceae bacterium]